MAHATIQTEFRGKFGSAVEKSAADWGAKLRFDLRSPWYLFVFIDWISRHGLKAKIGIAVDDEGLEIGSFLNGWVVNSGRTRSWNTPPSRLRNRLQEIKDHLEHFEEPPQDKVKMIFA